MRRSVGWLFMWAGVIACRDGPPTPIAIALDVAYAGCSAVLVGPVCELPKAPEKRQLRLWVPDTSPASLVVTSADQPLPFESRIIQGGRLLQVTVPAEAREIGVRVSRGARGAVFRWRLTIADPLTCSGLEAAKALRIADPEGALAKLKEVMERASPACQAQAVALEARIELRRNAPDRAIARLREAMRRNQRAGRLSDAVKDGFALSFALALKIHDFAGARQVLDEVASVLSSKGADDDEARAGLFYYRAVVAIEAGDLRASLQGLVEASIRSDRLELAQYAFAVRHKQADVLLRLGRVADARQRLEDLLAKEGPSLDPCTRAMLLDAYGWTLLRARNARESKEGPDPQPSLHEARRLYQRCKSPALEANVLVNLALAAVESGHLDEAAARLAEVRAVDPRSDAYVESWQQDVEGRLVLGRGDFAAAQQIYDAMLAVARPRSQARWRALIGRAQALEGQSRHDEAIADYRASEDVLEAQQVMIPIHEGRGTFFSFGDHEQGARRLVERLYDRERVDEAVHAARRARARVLSMLRAPDIIFGLSPKRRAVWEREIGVYRHIRDQIEQAIEALSVAPGDEREAQKRALNRLERQAEQAIDRAYQSLGLLSGLPEKRARPVADEVLLMYHPIDSGWLGFAVTVDSTVAQRLPKIDDRVLDAQPAQLSQILLAPFRAQIDAAQSIKVLGYGGLQSIDFHALPWKDGVLLDHAPVVYGLDLPLIEWSPKPPSSPHRALLVIDPRGNLRGARRAGRSARSSILTWPGWHVDPLYQRAATPEAVLEGLRRADLFHYAGHGLFAGHEGWHSKLALADRRGLTMGDILASHSLPARVILSGCSTAQTDLTAAAPTLGLAHAFVVAGAREVIATARPVQDRFAAELSDALYAQRIDHLSLPVALRHAQRALRHRHPSHWAAYRVLVP